MTTFRFEEYPESFRLCKDPTKCVTCREYLKAKAEHEKELADAGAEVMPYKVIGEKKPMSGKPLRKLMKEELANLAGGEANVSDDAADAAVEVVFDWLDRVERNGNIAMAGYWRQTADNNRKEEASDGRGR